MLPLEKAYVPAEAIATKLVDACQVVYNAYQQEHQEALFPQVVKEEVGIMARYPLDEGALTGKITPDTTFPEGD
jgi:aryl-alcohol dehydrogenase-like predicted oxidoreductase